MIYSPERWLKSYDPGVPAEIEPQRGSIGGRYRQTAGRYGSQTALLFMGATMTHGQVLEAAKRFAALLRAHGVGRGDVVGVYLPNTPQYVIAVLGALLNGSAITGVSPLLMPDELAHQLNDCGAKALVTLDALFQERLKGVADRIPGLKLVLATSIADYLPGLKRVLAKLLKKVPSGKVEPLAGKTVLDFRRAVNASPAEDLEVLVDENDLAFIQYTGGTTGLPKGAQLTHGNLLANLAQFGAWYGAKMGQGRYLSGYPMFHIAGLFLALNGLMFGGAQSLIPDPRNAKHIVAEMAAFKPSLMANVPSLWMMLLPEPGFKELDFSGLEVCITAAAPMPVESLKALEAVIGQGKISELVGMTETSPVIACNPVRGVKKAGSVGLPIPGTLVRLVDLAEGKDEVALGQAGELCVCGPQVMRGYHNKPDESAGVLRPHDGKTWMHTGDVAVMDEDGYLFIVDRTKDMVNVSGYKVFPREVEEKFYTHPAVQACAVVGVVDPDRPGSEIVKLVVQLDEAHKQKPGPEMEKELLAFIKDKVAPYKTPKLVQFVEQIPLTSVGKVDKKALR